MGAKMKVAPAAWALVSWLLKLEAESSLKASSLTIWSLDAEACSLNAL